MHDLTLPINFLFYQKKYAVEVCFNETNGQQACRNVTSQNCTLDSGVKNVTQPETQVIILSYY